MSSDAVARAAPLTAAGRVVAREEGGQAVRREDLGAFRASLPGDPDLVALRPAAEGLVVERSAVREVVPWDAIAGVTLTYADAAPARVPAARVHFASGPPLDFADGLAPGAGGLPSSLEEG